MSDTTRATPRQDISAFIEAFEGELSKADKNPLDALSDLLADSSEEQRPEIVRDCLSALVRMRPKDVKPREFLKLVGPFEGCASQLTEVFEELELDKRGDLKCLGERYEILHLLGSGGFGRVWLARDPLRALDVAIKVPYRGHPKAAWEEAMKLSTFQHQNVVKVLDVVSIPTCGQAIVFEYIAGDTLAEYLGRQPASKLPAREAVTLVATVARALDAVYKKTDLVHRDLKPANILLDPDGRPHIADFGLAVKAAECQSSKSICGTLLYMAPEQLQSTPAYSQRTDVWALGVILFQLLRGRLPIEQSALPKRDQPDGLAHFREFVQGVDLTRDNLWEGHRDGELKRICLKCLEKDPQKRYANCAALAKDLNWWSSRWRWRVIWGVLTVVVLLASYQLLYYRDPLVIYWEGTLNRESKVGWSELDLRNEQTLYSGDQLNVAIAPSDEAYIYIVSVAKTIEVLYPYNSESGARPKHETILYPEPGQTFALDNVTGAEELWLIASRRRNELLEKAARDHRPLSKAELETSLPSSQTSYASKPQSVPAVLKGLRRESDRRNPTNRKPVAGWEAVQGNDVVTTRIRFKHEPPPDGINAGRRLD